MLLPRSIPPPFLLPTRGARRLYRTLQQTEDAKVLNDEGRRTEPRAARGARKKDLGDGIMPDSVPASARRKGRKGANLRKVFSDIKLERWSTWLPSQPVEISPIDREDENIRPEAAGNVSGNGGDRLQQVTSQSQRQEGTVGGPVAIGNGFGARWKSLSKEQWDASKSFKPVESTDNKSEQGSKQLKATIELPKTGIDPGTEEMGVKGSHHDDTPRKPELKAQNTPAKVVALRADEYRAAAAGKGNELVKDHSQDLSDKLGQESEGKLRTNTKSVEEERSDRKNDRMFKIRKFESRLRIRRKSGQENIELARNHEILPYTPEEMTQIHSTKSIDMLDVETRSSLSDKSNDLAKEVIEESTNKSDDAGVNKCNDVELPNENRPQQCDQQHIQNVQEAVAADTVDAQQKLNNLATDPYKKVVDQSSPNHETRTAKHQRHKSLYEELFPEQKETSVPSPAPRKLVVQPFEWNKGLLGPWDHFNTKEGLAKYPPVETEIAADSDPYEVEKAYQDVRQPVVVVLEGASPNLEESDFFRITPKGAHIEGWTSGIIKGMSKPSIFH